MLQEKKLTIEKVDVKVRNVEEDFESFQYFVTKKIGRESGFISIDNIPGARNYDAVIDVNGRGDFKTIQEALNAGKRRIFLRSGTYEVTSSITLTDTSDITIIGEDKNTTIIKPNVDISAITVIDFITTGTNKSSRITIQNLTIDGDETNNGKDHYGIVLNNAEDCTINNVIIKDCGAVGVYFRDSGTIVKYNNSLSGSIIDNCETGVKMEFYYQQNIITNNRVTTSPSTRTTGMDINGVANVINDNQLWGYDYLLTLAGQDNIVSGNIFGNSQKYSLYAKAVKYVVINNNFFYGSKEHTVYGGGIRRSTISNNIFDNKTSNYFSSTNTYSFIILTKYAYDSTYNIINNNNFDGDGSTNDPKYCIREDDSNQDYNLINGNIAQGAATTNISTQGSNTIKANNIE